MFIFMFLGLTAFVTLIASVGEHFLHRWLIVTVYSIAFMCLFMFVMLIEVISGMYAAQHLGMTLVITAGVAALGVLFLLWRGAGARLKRIWTPG